MERSLGKRGGEWGATRKKQDWTTEEAPEIRECS